MGCESSRDEIPREWIEAMDIPYKEQIPLPQEIHELKDYEIQKLQHCCNIFMFMLEEGYSVNAANHVFDAETHWHLNRIRIDMIHQFDRTHAQGARRKATHTEQYLRSKGVLGDNEQLQ